MQYFLKVMCFDFVILLLFTLFIYNAYVVSPCTSTKAVMLQLSFPTGSVSRFHFTNITADMRLFPLNESKVRGLCVCTLKPWVFSWVFNLVRRLLRICHSTVQITLFCLFCYTNSFRYSHSLVNYLKMVPLKSHSQLSQNN